MFASYADPEIAKALLAAGAKINAPNDAGETPLMSAAKSETLWSAAAIDAALQKALWL